MVNMKLKGTGVAVVTPFNKDKSIDFKSFENLINYLLEKQVDYLVLMGTTSESPTISETEKEKLIECTKKIVGSTLPIVIGIGGNNTDSVITNITKQNLDGIAAILSVSPYYNKPSQTGIYEHYKLISELSPRPIILYNVPGRTQSNITAETTLQLAHKCKNIIGIKEASSNFPQIMQILKKRPDDFLVISGDDITAFPFMTLGGDGVISVAANALPQSFSNMVRLCLNKEYNKAKKIHFELLELIQLLSEEGNPSGIKATLNILAIIQNNLRLPLTPIEKNYDKIKEEITLLRTKKLL